MRLSPNEKGEGFEMYNNFSESEKLLAILNNPFSWLFFELKQMAI